MAAAIRAAGGEIYAITSEPQTLARNARDEWETGLEHVGDPHHEIAGACRERGWLSLFTNTWDALGDGPSSVWRSHPKGYFQPGVLAVSRSARVLYRWRSRPTRSNTGGATGRPTPEHVWSRVQGALAEAADAPDVAHDDEAVLDSPPTFWPFFVLLLLANGWFLRPRTFDQGGGELTPAQRIRRAMRRLVVFAAGWIVAAILLPLWLVGLALAAWVVAILPGLRAVHAAFQHIAPGEEPT